MDKSWQNLLLDDDRPRVRHVSDSALPVFGGRAPKRFRSGTHDQELGAEIEGKYSLTLGDPGRTLAKESDADNQLETLGNE